MTSFFFRPTLEQMKKYSTNIGALIKDHRAQAGLTQLQLAHKLGYEIPQFISLIENGHSKVPLNIVSQLISILDIPENLILDALVEAYIAETKDILNINRRKSAKKKPVGGR